MANGAGVEAARGGNLNLVMLKLETAAVTGYRCMEEETEWSSRGVVAWM